MKKLVDFIVIFGLLIKFEKIMDKTKCIGINELIPTYIINHY